MALRIRRCFPILRNLSDLFFRIYFVGLMARLLGCNQVHCEMSLELEMGSRSLRAPGLKCIMGWRERALEDHNLRCSSANDTTNFTEPLTQNIPCRN
jgi:hypothetical protein